MQCEVLALAVLLTYTLDTFKIIIRHSQRLNMNNETPYNEYGTDEE